MRSLTYLVIGLAAVGTIVWLSSAPRATAQTTDNKTAAAQYQRALDEQTERGKRAAELLRGQDELHKRAETLVSTQEQMLKRQEADMARFEKILETWETQQKQYQKYLDSLGK